jgi:site-specific recombinase XerD
MAALLYGTGMRLMECVRLRVQDIDFQYHQILVRDGKGQKDRVVPLPSRLEQPLREYRRGRMPTGRSAIPPPTPLPELTVRG